MAGRFNWRGDDVTRRLVRAAKIGIDETLAACVVEAKSNHPYVNRTGTAEGSVRMVPAQQEGRRIVGRWGSFIVRYFIFLEIGTTRTPGGFPSLRPAADKEYPKLRRRIRAANA